MDQGVLLYSHILHAQDHWHPVGFVFQFGNELETPALCSSSGHTECKQFSRDLLRKHEAAVI